MKQRIIALASILSGVGVMGLVVWLHHDPLAWTSAPRPTANAMNAMQPTVASHSSPPTQPLPRAASPTAGVLQLPEVRIESRIAIPRAETKGAAESLEPCSEWRDIGPAYVDDGTPLGTRHVRNLC